MDFRPRRGTRRMAGKFAGGDSGTHLDVRSAAHEPQRHIGAHDPSHHGSRHTRPGYWTFRAPSPRPLRQADAARRPDPRVGAQSARSHRARHTQSAGVERSLRRVPQSPSTVAAGVASGAHHRISGVAHGHGALRRHGHRRYAVVVAGHDGRGGRNRGGAARPALGWRCDHEGCRNHAETGCGITDQCRSRPRFDHHHGDVGGGPH